MQSKLPQPTREQCEEFAHHVCGAHSWYKHIPLVQGREFVFFFSQEAGAGYSKDKPRIHYAWRTTEEYRRRFGYLDYACRPNGSQFFYRDSLAASFVPSDELLSYCSTVLYPYVSNCHPNAETVLSHLIAEKYLDEFRATPNHPRHREVLEWFEAMQRCWDNNRRQPDITDRRAELEMKAGNLYAALQEGELNKIRTLLMRLCELSETEVQVWW